MRLRWIVMMIPAVLLTASCATTDTGPRFKSLRAKEQQQIRQELEKNWSQYTIYYIPQHAVLFDPQNDLNTIKVSGRWIRVGEGVQQNWIDVLRKHTQESDSAFSVWMGSKSGFLRVIGPDEQFFGYLVHDTMDLVALKVLDRNTMRIYYSPRRTEGR